MGAGEILPPKSRVAKRRARGKVRVRGAPDAVVGIGGHRAVLPTAPKAGSLGVSY